MEISLGQWFQQTLDIADGQNGFVIINIDQKQQMLLGIFLLVWCRQQMILRNLNFLLIGVAGKLNDFHPIQQRPWNRIQ